MKKNKLLSDREHFAKKILRLKKRQHWDFVLSGRRNLSYKRACTAAEVLGTAADIWQDAKMVLARQEAWKRYSSNN